LIDRRIIARRLHETRTCRNNLCQERNWPVEEQTRSVCARCESELLEFEFTRLERNESTIADTVANILDDADDWQLADNSSELDGVRYYELHHRTESRDEVMCMILSDRPSPRVFRMFDRTGLPVLFVQAQTDSRHFFVDRDGSERLSLSYVLSSLDSEATKRECVELFRDQVKRLVRNHEERILRAARASHERLLDSSVRQSGDCYELDIFNLLRSIFPYTYNLGRQGKIDPDGYVCLPHYTSKSIEDVDSWNWSYDAKHSAHRNGYDFNIDESRKVINYIEKVRNNRRALFGRNRRLRAHIVIPNNLPEARMQHSASIIFGDDGVGVGNRDVRLLLMKHEFLIVLYERVRDAYDAIQRRRAHFGTELEDVPERQCYVLDRAHANALCDKVLQLPEIEENVDQRTLLTSLNE
jgi:hypothetical protein